MNECEQLAKLPEAFDVVVPVKLLSKEVADSDGTIRVEYQLEMQCPDIGRDNPENKEWHPRFEMRFPGEFIQEADSREVEKTLRERVQNDLEFGIAYQIVHNRIVVLPKKEHELAVAVEDMVGTIEAMSSAERKWLRFSAWVMCGLKRFFRKKPKQWDMATFVDLVARLAEEDGVDFRKYRVMKCKRRTQKLEIVRIHGPILTRLPGVPSKPPQVRTIILTPGEGPRSGRITLSNAPNKYLAREFWALIEPMLRGFLPDKRTIIGIHESTNELLFCVVRDAPEDA